MRFNYFSIFFFEYCIRQETIFPHLSFYQKHLGKPSSKKFPVSTRSKTYLTGTTAVDTQQMSKIQSRLVAKTKIIQTRSV